MTEPSGAENRRRPGPRPALQDLAEALRDGFGLDHWTVEPKLNRIVSASGSEHGLDPRLIDVLVYMASRPAQVVTRDELLGHVWKGTFVSENTVSQAISRLRKALGDDPQEPRFIETISKSGYRLVAPVAWTGPIPADPPGIGAVSPVSESPSRPAVRAGGLVWVVLAAVLVVGLAAGAWVLSIGQSTVPSSSAGIALIAPESTLVGTQFDPRLSPQGDRVAFAWMGPDQSGWDLWIQHRGADNPARLTEYSESERLPTWSGDGTWIAFVRFTEEDCGIFRIPAQGGTSDRIADCLPNMRSMSLAPDDRTLVLSGSVDPGDSRVLYEIDLTTGDRRQLTRPPAEATGDFGMVHSPDGTRLAFLRGRGPWRHDVMVLQLDRDGEGAEHALTSDAWGQVRGLDWVADGTSVVFSSNREGRFALWRVPVRGGAAQRLPIQDDWVTQPSVSRQGGELIYRTFRDVVDVWEIPVGGRTEATVSSQADAVEAVRRVPSTRSERQPAWSPDGKRIAFISDRSGSYQLWTGNPDGTELLRHTDLAGPMPESPTWSPDGKRLLFHTSIDGHSDLWIVEGDSRRPIRLTETPTEERNGSFSRDGEMIYFASDRSGGWDIWRMPAAGGTAARFTDDGSFLAQESHDGRTVFTVRLEEPGIWSRPAAGGRPDKVLSELDLADWGSWVVAENGIYHVRRGPTTIHFLPFDGSEARPVHQPGKQIPYFGRALSLSADGRALLFSMIDHSDDEIMRARLAGL